MTSTDTSNTNGELELLCTTFRILFKSNEFEKCETLITDSIGKYPHAPQPHNLFGVLFEKEGRHPEAMKHFRAAWALDPTYLPARNNMELYGSFFFKGNCAIDETDCGTDYAAKGAGK